MKSFWKTIAIPSHERRLKKELAHIFPLFAKEFGRACHVCDDIAVFCEKNPLKRKEFVETGLAALDRYVWTRPELAGHFAGKMLAVCGPDTELKEQCVKQFLSKFPGKSWMRAETKFFLETVFLGLDGNKALKSLSVKTAVSQLDVTQCNPYQVKVFLENVIDSCGEDQTARSGFFEAALTLAASCRPDERETKPFLKATFPFVHKPARHLTVVPPERKANDFRAGCDSGTTSLYPVFAQRITGVLLKTCGHDEIFRPRVVEGAFSAYFMIAPRNGAESLCLLKQMAESEGGDLSLFSNLFGTLENGGIAVFSGMRAAGNPLSVYLKQQNGSELIIAGPFGDMKAGLPLTLRQQRDLGLEANSSLKGFLVAAREVAREHKDMPPIAETFSLRAAGQRARRLASSGLKLVT